MLSTLRWRFRRAGIKVKQRRLNSFIHNNKTKPKHNKQKNKKQIKPNNPKEITQGESLRFLLVKRDPVQGCICVNASTAGPCREAALGLGRSGGAADSASIGCTGSHRDALHSVHLVLGELRR